MIHARAGVPHIASSQSSIQTQDHHWPRPTLFRPGYGGSCCNLFYEITIGGSVAKIELDRLNAQLVVEDII